MRNLDTFMPFDGQCQLRIFLEKPCTKYKSIFKYYHELFKPQRKRYPFLDCRLQYKLRPKLSFYDDA